MKLSPVSAAAGDAQRVLERRPAGRCSARRRRPGAQASAGRCSQAQAGRRQTSSAPPATEDDEAQVQQAAPHRRAVGRVTWSGAVSDKRHHGPRRVLADGVLLNTGPESRVRIWDISPPVSRASPVFPATRRTRSNGSRASRPSCPVNVERGRARRTSAACRCAAALRRWRAGDRRGSTCCPTSLASASDRSARVAGGRLLGPDISCRVNACGPLPRPTSCDADARRFRPRLACTAWVCRPQHRSASASAPRRRGRARRVGPRPDPELEHRLDHAAAARGRQDREAVGAAR